MIFKFGQKIFSWFKPSDSYLQNYVLQKCLRAYTGPQWNASEGFIDEEVISWNWI